MSEELRAAIEIARRHAREALERGDSTEAWWQGTEAMAERLLFVLPLAATPSAQPQGLDELRAVTWNEVIHRLDNEGRRVSTLAASALHRALRNATAAEQRGRPIALPSPEEFVQMTDGRAALSIPAAGFGRRSARLVRETIEALTASPEPALAASPSESGLDVERLYEVITDEMLNDGPDDTVYDVAARITARAREYVAAEKETPGLLPEDRSDIQVVPEGNRKIWEPGPPARRTRAQVDSDLAAYRERRAAEKETP